jgi:hypothetical protein
MSLTQGLQQRSPRGELAMEAERRHGGVRSRPSARPCGGGAKFSSGGCGFWSRDDGVMWVVVFFFFFLCCGFCRRMWGFCGLWGFDLT